MFKKEDEMPKGAFGNFARCRPAGASGGGRTGRAPRSRKSSWRSTGGGADGCDRAAFGAMVGEVFPQLGPLDGEAVDAAFAECRRLARRAPEAIVDDDPNEAAVDLTTYRRTPTRRRPRRRPSLR